MGAICGLLCPFLPPFMGYSVTGFSLLFREEIFKGIFQEILSGTTCNPNLNMLHSPMQMQFTHLLSRPQGISFRYFNFRRTIRNEKKIKSTQEDKCMNSGLKKYFPMIRERQEVLKRIQKNKKLEAFHYKDIKLSVHSP